jgi:cytochrome c-type biogenesis protein CcmH
MIAFSIAAVLLSAVAAALILQRAACAARRSDADPTLAVYRRQVSEIDDLAERGLLAEGELRAARAEASRRLLAAARSPDLAADSAPVEGQAARPKVSRGVRLTVLAGAVIAPLLAVGLYSLRGSPDVPDQPFAQRLKDWTSADPAGLGPAQMAAVLETIVKARPNEVEPLTYLARAQAATGNLPAATETIRKATRLAPRQAGLWSDLGQLLVMQSQGHETAEAVAAFRRAVALDPKLPSARYHLDRARIVGGDLAGGLAGWRALAQDMPAGDPQRVMLEAEIDATAKAGHLTTPQAASEPQPAPAAAASAGGADQRAFIQSMVDRLAARLKASPDDPAGWARLIRSYAILGDSPKMQAALDRAHALFKDRPADLKTVDNAMTGPAQ